MKFALTSFCVSFFLKLLIGCYELEIRDWQETALALICFFLCGMCLGEYIAAIIMCKSYLFHKDLGTIFEKYGAN